MIAQLETSNSHTYIAIGNILRMERDHIVMTVAANIQYYMELRGMNPAELARKAGINQTGVYDILSGKSRSPRLDTIGKIATALSVPVAALFEERTEDSSLIDLRNQALSLLGSVPRDESDKILRALRALVSPV